MVRLIYLYLLMADDVHYGIFLSYKINTNRGFVLAAQAIWRNGGIDDEGI